jgi:DNA-binding CsgD family transcriptional regulator
MGADALANFMEKAQTSWGSGATLKNFAPGRVDDARFQAWWARFERLSASPTAAIALARMNAQIDVRHVLGSIRVPTLIIHRTDDARVRTAGGRYLAEKIKGARFVEIPGRDHPIWTGDIDRVVDEIGEFLTGVRPFHDTSRVLATLLVARLVTSGRVAARLGDRQWSERMDRLREAATETVLRHGGMLFAAGAEEIAARFDGPARAVRCAQVLRDSAQALDLEIAVGIHAGEVEIDMESVAGLALHVTGRISARAKAGEILVSGLVTDLVAGSGLHFTQRDSTEIDGLENPLRLFAVVTEQHLEPAARAHAAVEPPSLETLSAREREVLALVAEGLSNAAIAARLRLSDHTVKRHVANILLKLDMPTRAAAAALLARQRPA